MNVDAVRQLTVVLWAGLLVVVVAWGCSTGASQTDTSSAGQEHNQVASSRTADSSNQRVEAIRVEDGEVLGGTREVEVELGQEITIEIESDEADELHIHGYDVSRDVAAGTPASVSFVVDIPGEFAIELEDHHLALILLRVR